MSKSLLVLPNADESVYHTSPETVLKLESDNITYVYYEGQRICRLGQKRALPNEVVHPEPGYEFGRCKMIKINGSRCRNPVRQAWTVCRSHGAGVPTRPGGRPPITGRHSKFLPTKMLETYEQFLSDPDILSLRSEMALMDARLAQQLRRLETNDSKEAWRLVSQAHVTLRMILDSPTGECDSDDLAAISLSLRNALDAHATDKEVWDDVQAIIMVRTKLADTERRRIVDARRFLTIEEANAMLAFVMDTVFTNVKDASVRAQIAERMKMFAQRSAQSGTQVIEQMPDDAMIEDIDERAEVVMGDEVIDA